ncbi:MAG TPA: hypothetical protein VHM91_18490, partial [Verrucomicrobiales bacterium]|nr:hypothetical protein [Verrucomicrobiales bacterium]
ERFAFQTAQEFHLVGSGHLSDLRGEPMRHSSFSAFHRLYYGDGHAEKGRERRLGEVRRGGPNGAQRMPVL